MKLYGKALATAVFLASVGFAHAQEKVRIAYSTGSFAFMPFLATDALGLFEQEGLDVELIRAGSGSKTMAAVAGGSADLAVGSSSTVLYARKEGLDLQIFASLVDQYSSSIALSKEWAASHNITEESPLADRLAALKGSRLATSGPGGGDHIIRFLAQLAGLDPDRDMTIIHLGNDMGVYLAAMEEGRIDGFAISEPTPHLAEREVGAVVAFDLARGDVKELDGFPYIIAHGKESWMEQNPESVKNVYEAFSKTFAELKDPAKADEVREKVRAAHYPDIDAELFAALWPSAVASIPDTPEVKPEDILRVVEFVNQFDENKIDVANVEGASTNAYVSTGR